jgi:hypothetical protein
MKQYLLSVYQPDGDPPPAPQEDDARTGCADHFGEGVVTEPRN